MSNRSHLVANRSTVLTAQANSAHCNRAREIPKMRKTYFVVFALCLVPRVFAQSGPVQTATITISSGQLQHLKAAPVQLVAAPGAGQMLDLISATMQYKTGATVYSVSSPGSLALWLGSAANGNKLTFIAASGFLDQAEDQIVTSSV